MTLVGCAAAGWPLAVRAQQPTLPVIGYLSSTSSGPYAPFVAAYQQGLKEAGFVPGQNVAIEYRWAEGQFDRLSGLATDLVRRQVAIIAVGGGGVTALAAKEATSTIPIVFAFGSDPVKLGLRDLLPKAVAIGFLVNPRSPNTAFDLAEMQVAARGLGLQLFIVNARDEREIDTAFSDLAQQGAAALVVQPEPFLFSRRNQLVALATHYAIPAIYFEREFPTLGGLMSYGPDFREVNRQAGIYTGRILKGAKPADLPVVQSTKFELVINLRAAKALGLELPATLLTLASEVIE